ncbi:ribonuclease H-like domain-containing protein [Tanacetum coccineum]
MQFPLPTLELHPPARADLSFAGLDDSVYKSKMSETITSVPNVETTTSKTSKDSLEKAKTVRLSAPIIEDWESDSEDENVFAPKEVKKTVKSSFEKIEFVNARNSTIEKPKEIQSFNHPIKDYDFHDKKMGNPQYALQDQGIFDRSSKGGKITRKGKIRTGKLDFEDVYFVKELKFNLFSVSQMCDKKNSVLFIETECLVLSPDFKQLDESQVLLKIPRQNNMYGFDLKNVVPSGDLTCLFAKATIDESNLWHRRLGHINFKTINKLMRGNLVRVSVRSINRKSYCLVALMTLVDLVGFSFLAIKDETPEILKNFITGIENQSDHKVKAIRNDNGTEFKNRIMNEFYEMKGIRREFSVARTPYPKNSKDEVADDAGKKNRVEDPAKEDDINGLGEATNTNSTNRLNTVSSPVNVDANSTYRMSTPVSATESSYENLGGSTPVNAATPSNANYPTDPLMPDLEDTADL